VNDTFSVGMNMGLIIQHLMPLRQHAGACFLVEVPDVMSELEVVILIGSSILAWNFLIAVGPILITVRVAPHSA
jgi:hypothetical protein